MSDDKQKRSSGSFIGDDGELHGIFRDPELIGQENRAQNKRLIFKDGKSHVQAIREAMLTALSPSEMYGLMRKTYNIAIRSQSEERQLEAINLIFNRLFGKPLAPVQMKQEIHHSASIDISKISEDEMREATMLLTKMEAKYLENK